MDIVKEFKELDFKHVRTYPDEKDPIKLLEMLKETDTKDLIQKSKIIKQLIYKCQHIYPDAKYPDHPKYQECLAMNYDGPIDDCNKESYKEYVKSSNDKKEGEEGYDPSLFCSICGLDIKKLVYIRDSIEWMEHCSAVEGW